MFLLEQTLQYMASDRPDTVSRAGEAMGRLAVFLGPAGSFAYCVHPCKAEIAGGRGQSEEFWVAGGEEGREKMKGCKGDISPLPNPRSCTQVG